MSVYTQTSPSSDDAKITRVVFAINESMCLIQLTYEEIIMFSLNTLLLLYFFIYLVFLYYYL